MPEAATVEESAKDIAWASIITPLSAPALIDFCQQDIERLLRINPFLEFSEWSDLGHGRYHLFVRNSSQKKPFELDTEVQCEHQPDGVRLRYKNGLKITTSFSVEPAGRDSKLTITDYYDSDLSEEEKAARMVEVDKSLQVLARDFQQYLINWKKWSRFALWRWYMSKVWQPMKPTARRITYMLLWISIVEIVLMMLGVGMYFLYIS
jgi:hypothetical protein